MNRLGNRKFRIIFLSTTIFFMIGLVSFSIFFVAKELRLITSNKTNYQSQPAHFDIEGYESLQKK